MLRKRLINDRDKGEIKMHQSDIDFVVLWVDPNDPAWQAEKHKYTPSATDDVQVIRYQSWDNLQYWFRAVAEYAPWVRKVHLVTCGQVPSWLNTKHPKINLVNHEDYMPSTALPTFNSNAIEVGIYRIPDLAEKFVLFNDDMFLTAPILESYYFHNGAPVDMPGLIKPPAQMEDGLFSSLLKNNAAVIARNFDKKQVLRNKKIKWLNPLYGKTFLRTLRYYNSVEFPGFVIPHLSTAYLKEDFRTVWEKEPGVLRATEHHRFRSAEDVTHFLIRNWRMCKGQFVPRKSTGKYFSVNGEKEAQTIAEAIKKQGYPEICINEQCSGEEFEQVKMIVNKAFSENFPNECEFEL